MVAVSDHVVVCCDGHRHGQPCRGALHTRTRHAPTAIGQAWRAGWRSIPTPGGVIELCPSGGHDEDDTGGQTSPGRG